MPSRFGFTSSTSSSMLKPTFFPTFFSSLSSPPVSFTVGCLITLVEPSPSIRIR